MKYVEIAWKVNGMQDTKQQTSSFIVDGCMVIINKEKEQCGVPATKTYKCLIGLPDGSDEWHDIKVCDHHARHFKDNNI